MFSRGCDARGVYRRQNFDKFVVVDFEATCDKDAKINPQEIIEFPSVIVSALTGGLEAAFRTHVRPQYHPILTDFCKELTGIQQVQVERSVSLFKALLIHDEWLESKGVKQSKFAVVTWGDWDCRTMLNSECGLKRIKKPPYFNSWINLKVAYEQVFGFRCDNLKQAVEHAGITWHGRPHSGLDDARNTAHLLSCLIGLGFCFSITGSLVGQPGPSATPVNKPEEENDVCCSCGVRSNKCMIRKPGPNQGRWFFGCGNWTPQRGAVCNFFAWASPVPDGVIF